MLPAPIFIQSLISGIPAHALSTMAMAAHAPGGTKKTRTRSPLAPVPFFAKPDQRWRRQLQRAGFECRQWPPLDFGRGSAFGSSGGVYSGSVAPCSAQNLGRPIATCRPRQHWSLWGAWLYATGGTTTHGGWNESKWSSHSEGTTALPTSAWKVSSAFFAATAERLCPSSRNCTALTLSGRASEALRHPKTNGR